MSKRTAILLALLLSATSLGGVAWAQATGLKATTILQAATTPEGQPIQFPLFRNQFTASLVEIAAGGQVGRHMRGSVPVKFLVVYAGEEGKPTTFRP